MPDLPEKCCGRCEHSVANLDPATVGCGYPLPCWVPRTIEMAYARDANERPLRDGTDCPAFSPKSKEGTEEQSDA